MSFCGNRSHPCMVVLVSLCFSVQLRAADELQQPIGTSPRTAIAKNHQPALRRALDSESAQRTESVRLSSIAEANPADVSAEQVIVKKEPQDDAPSIEELESHIKFIDETDTLNAEEKKQLRVLAQQAVDWRKRTVELSTKASSRLKDLDSVPQQIESLNTALREAEKEIAVPEVSHASSSELEQMASQLAEQLAEARELLVKHQAEAKELQKNRKSAQDRRKELSEQRAEIEGKLDESLPENTSPFHAKIIRAEQQTHLLMLDALQEQIKVDAKYARAVHEVQPLQHDLDRRRIAQLEAAHQNYDKALTAKHHVEAQERIAEAKRKAREADPALRELAEMNAQLAEKRSIYNERKQTAASELSTINEQFADQEKSFNGIQAKVEDIGMTEAIGVLLRSQDHALIDDRPLRKRAKQIEEELPKVELDLLQTKDEREAMWQIDKLTEDYARRLAARFSDSEARTMVRELLETRRGYLGDLLADLRDYEETLADLHIALKNTAEVTSDHHRYINEHVLWIRSADPVAVKDVEDARSGLATLFNPERWLGVVTETGRAIQSRMVLSLICFAGLTICLVLCDRLKDRISSIGETPSVKTCFRFYPTVDVTVATLILACFLPAVCFFVSWCVLQFRSASDLTYSIGVGLKWTSLMWLGLSILQQTVREGGLAQKHFGWHDRNIKVIRHNLQLLLLFGLPAVFLVMLIETFQQGRWVSSLGRLSFMAGMAIMSLFMHRLLNPYSSSGGLWANRKLFVYRARFVLHFLCVAMPLGLSVFAALGYVYSAHQLAYRAQLSLWLVLLVVLSHGLIGRYLLIARRTAAARQTQRRREEADDGDSDTTPEELDFQEIGDQLNRLLRGCAAVTCLLGASIIWADMVPALMFFDRVELWQSTQVVTQTVPLEDGTEGTSTSTEIVRITLADALFGVLALAATIMAARNIPGLLNVTIFERLPIDFGTRYALTAVSRYVISLVGIVTAFYLVGITWSSVQWLVAAMTVGLGFGLQEIFANFVSGLIILTERPVRVGDMVTVGGVTGKVTRVQIRATTITDFDRRELVVPNKRFITEDVINWTLSDPITRVVLPVGIAYDCEPQVAREQLLRVAAENPLVLSEPEPTAIFMGFGDSTLDLELRVFIVGRDNLFQVRDELNRAINTAFKAASLEIAYPQRDLHIRSVSTKVLPTAAAPSSVASPVATPSPDQFSPAKKVA